MIAVLLGTPAVSAAVPADDHFIAGYVAAILEREFSLTNTTVTVENGTVEVEVLSLAGHNRDQIETALAGVRGVTAVVIRVFDSASPPPAPAAPPAGEPGPAAKPRRDEAATVAVGRQGVQILPRATLFKPLRADPRWPHFSAAYQHFEGEPAVQHAGTVSFGENLSLVRGNALDGQFELNFQAGVFAVFDLDSDSEDLINADYLVGLPVVYRKDNFSALFRVYHQSSHLGDEFLLRETTDQESRVNLSYEGVNFLLSYDFGELWRVYGGAGYLLGREPKDFDPAMVQTGLEYQSDLRFWDLLRPVAALDIQAWEEQDWDPDFSLRAGFRLGDPGSLGEQVELTAEYYNGRNPNGQFFVRDLEYFGLGLHLYFN